jgi:hypothetical protein
MELTQEQIDKVATEAWSALEGQSEARYVHDDDEHPYKPFYRMATILVMDNWGPPHLKLLGLRRHLTPVEAVAVARKSHPYLAKHLVDHEGQAHFLRLFNDFAEMYDPEGWRCK